MRSAAATYGRGGARERSRDAIGDAAGSMGLWTYRKRASGVIDALAARAREVRGAPPWDRLVEEATATRSFVREVPKVGPDGFLPAGVHDADLGSFLLHVGTNDHRRALYSPVGRRMLQLRERGVDEVFVAGSGIHGKPRPGDVDALFHVTDAGRLPIRERLADWVVGTRWHGAERRHAAVHTDWGLSRPTWLEFMSHRRAHDVRVPSAVIRVRLAEHPQAALGMHELGTVPAAHVGRAARRLPGQ